ncbi:hypothetical protein BGZ63DRAFT_429018 [Mariannaea sp. PMI_226]|nr:hypothetical protein BGZ63DRAFT_429018 [Mariannaea sp. PMI_226]
MFISRAVTALAIAGAGAAGLKMTMQVPDWIPWENATALEGSLVTRLESATTVALSCKNEGRANAFCSETVNAMTVTWGPSTAGYLYYDHNSVSVGWANSILHGGCKVKDSSLYGCIDITSAYTDGWPTDSSTIVTVATSYSTILALEVNITSGLWKLDQQPPYTEPPSTPTDGGNYGATSYPTSQQYDIEGAGLGPAIIGAAVGGTIFGSALVATFIWVCIRDYRKRSAAIAASIARNNNFHLPTYQAAQDDTVVFVGQNAANAPPPTYQLAVIAGGNQNK